MALKDRISSPLEAGPSILDGHNLPVQLSSALEYASKRLARKALHLTLVVVRRDYQLPISALSSPKSAGTPSSPPSTTSAVPVSTASTPARTAFNLASIKNFVRSNTSPLPQSNGGVSPERHGPSALDLQRNGMVSPAFSISSISSASTASMSSAADSTFSSGHRLRWPLSPTTPSTSSMPMTPATPFTATSYATTTDGGSAMSGAVGPQGSGPFGIRLVHVSPLSVREEKVLKYSLEKAGRKFRIGTDWLPNAVSPSTYGLNADLMHRSLAQNEVLFSSDGLTLLSLDHLYTFKAALASYARTQSPRRLEDAVDELRRRVLSHGRQKLRKSDLLAAYTWLGQVSDSALSDVTRMYRRAYGGAVGEGGVENDIDRGSPSWPLPDRPDAGQALPGEKPLPALPATSEADDGRGDSSSFTRRSDRDLEKRFCIDFDFDLEIEEYYRERAREMEAEKAQMAEAEKEASAAADAAAAAALEEMRRTTPKLASPPPPRMPVLKLQTTFDKKPGLLKPVPHKQAVEKSDGNGADLVGLQVDGGAEAQPEDGIVRVEVDDEEEEELTARPKSGHPNTLAAGLSMWNTMTIDEMINDVESKINRIGPMTPNGYEDISPITRGEWGFLMVGDGWKKTAAVETC